MTGPVPRMTRAGKAPWAPVALVLAAAALAVVPAQPVAAARDPFEPPARVRPPPPGPAAKATAWPVIRHLVNANGRRWVLDHGRRLGPGDRLGGLRIECIHDDGITAVDAAGIRHRLPLFGRVQIRPAGAAATPRPFGCPGPTPQPPAPRPPR